MSSYCAGCGEWIERGGMLCDKCGGIKADNKRLQAENARPIEDDLQRRLDIAVKALTEISISTNEAYLTGGREMKRIASQAIAEIRKEGKE